MLSLRVSRGMFIIRECARPSHLFGFVSCTHCVGVRDPLLFCLTFPLTFSIFSVYILAEVKGDPERLSGILSRSDQIMTLSLPSIDEDYCFGSHQGQMPESSIIIGCSDVRDTRRNS